MVYVCCTARVGGINYEKFGGGIYDMVCFVFNFFVYFLISFIFIYLFKIYIIFIYAFLFNFYLLIHRIYNIYHDNDEKVDDHDDVG